MRHSVSLMGHCDHSQRNKAGGGWFDPEDFTAQKVSGGRCVVAGFLARAAVNNINSSCLVLMAGCTFLRRNVCGVQREWAKQFTGDGDANSPSYKLFESFFISVRVQPLFAGDCQNQGGKLSY